MRIQSSCSRRTSLIPRNTRRKPAPRSAIERYARTTYRDAILEAAEQLFLRVGYSEARMADLAAEAGVAVGTLYKHFPSKEAVFASLCSRNRDELFQTLNELLAIESPAERLQAIVLSVFSYVEQRGALFAVYGELGVVMEAHLRSLGGEGAEQTYDRFLRLLESVLRDGAEAGQVRKDIPPLVLATTFAGAMNSALFAWVRANREYSLADRAGPLIELFLQGAKSP